MWQFGWGWEGGSLYIKSQPPAMPRTVLKVCGRWWGGEVGGGRWWWLRPILVFSLSVDQAEQKLYFRSIKLGIEPDKIVFYKELL